MLTIPACPTGEETDARQLPFRTFDTPAYFGLSSSRTYEKQLTTLLAANNVSYAQLEETLAS